MFEAGSDLSERTKTWTAVPDAFPGFSRKDSVRRSRRELVLLSLIHPRHTLNLLPGHVRRSHHVGQSGDSGPGKETAKFPYSRPSEPSSQVGVSSAEGSVGGGSAVIGSFKESCSAVLTEALRAVSRPTDEASKFSGGQEERPVGCDKSVNRYEARVRINQDFQLPSRRIQQQAKSAADQIPIKVPKFFTRTKARTCLG